MESKRYRYIPSPFCLPKSRQKKLFAAGLTIVFCDVNNRKVYLCDGNTCDSIHQQTRDNTRQRAEIYLAPNFIVFLDDKMTEKSKTFLSKCLPALAA